jgi:hypothetical protein
MCTKLLVPGVEQPLSKWGLPLLSVSLHSCMHAFIQQAYIVHSARGMTMTVPTLLGLTMSDGDEQGIERVHSTSVTS